jgi:hypothetical protein
MKVSEAVMQLHGSLADNLRAALSSMRRLRAHPVHEDTVAYWRELLHLARHGLREGTVRERSLIEILVVEIEKESIDSNWHLASSRLDPN